ncbi:MAG: electron transport complex subunit RsxC [Candidatus Faecousia sp.]|nr:electron transport complex subunit RsxC [Clostridiales bacterium]MCI6936581.1 electron transport complex subunit RsxC [Clostridiales bacterium]MDD5884163.1 electron transport complex subunit RsxC [Bacillota bacterium]MDY4599157.1 electron transport complex subunit RsxC [Candidatus Faecousia sp.]
MAFSFFGGVHPKENKWYACDKETQVFPEPDIVVIPMAQHIGAPCKPLVAKGDLVTRGQKIGDNQGLCVPVHASVSGKVKAVEMRPHTNGSTVLSVVIENDHLDTLCEDIKPRTQEEVDALTPEQLVDIIHEAGIVGMGGATFPTHVKLSGGIGKVDTAIVNAGECEPYITADDRLCREHPEQVVKGLRIIMKIFGLKEGHIGIEDNKPEAIAALKAAAGEDILVDVLPAKYPQGAEKQLIYAITGREVPSGGLPAAVGCAVFNAATTRAICEAVYDGMPLIQRIVTVSGDILMEPKNLLVPIGTAFNDLIEACGRNENPYKVLSGGPMMGVAQYDLNVPTIKGVNAVTVLGKNNHHFVEDPHCLRCGKCIDACPMKLMPVLMYKAWQNGDVEEMKKNNIMDCIECGSCAYTCPASVPLVLGFRVAKQVIRNASAPVKK